MLGRKDFTREEIDRSRAVIDQQLVAHTALVEAVGDSGDAAAAEAVERLEAGAANALLLTLDRPFVHRIRKVAGKEGNPVNEVEVLVDALLGDGVLRPHSVIKLDRDTSVTGIAFGEQVVLTLDQLARLSAAFHDELEAWFLA